MCVNKRTWRDVCRRLSDLGHVCLLAGQIIKGRGGSGFYKMFCIFATLSHYSTCLAYKFLSWNKIFYVKKHRFCGMLHHPSVYFGEIICVMWHIVQLGNNIILLLAKYPSVGRVSAMVLRCH